MKPVSFGLFERAAKVVGAEQALSDRVFPLKREHRLVAYTLNRAGGEDTAGIDLWMIAQAHAGPRIVSRAAIAGIVGVARCGDAGGEMGGVQSPRRAMTAAALRTGSPDLSVLCDGVVELDEMAASVLAVAHELRAAGGWGSLGLGGLGLSNSKAIVEAHGGQVGIESAVGEGVHLLVRPATGQWPLGPAEELLRRRPRALR